MKQIVGVTVSQLALTTSPPSGAVGIDLAQSYPENTMRPMKWLITAIVTVASSNLIVWGSLAQGVIDISADDKWGQHNDKYGLSKNGILGTALAVGTQHFVFEDVAIYDRLYFQKSAGTIDVYLTPIYESDKSS